MVVIQLQKYKTISIRGLWIDQKRLHKKKHIDKMRQIARFFFLFGKDIAIERRNGKT